MNSSPDLVSRLAASGSTVLWPRCPGTASCMWGKKWSQKNWRSWTWTSGWLDPGLDSSTPTTSANLNSMLMPASSNLVRTFIWSNLIYHIISSRHFYCTLFYIYVLLNAGPQLSALPLDSSLLLPPKVQPPLNPTSSAQPASSGQPQAWGSDGEQAPGAASSGNAPTPSGATSNQTGETTQGATGDTKGPSSATPPANTPAENPEL